MTKKDLLEAKAKLVRKWCLLSTTKAESGHPSSCLSAVELTTVLFDKYFRYDLKNPLNLYNDRFVLSKGHAAPLLYTLFALSGAYSPEELLTLRKFGSRLEGHPTPVKYPFAEAATGSLGQGLSIGAGMSLLAKRENLPFKCYVLLGDGELAEGQIWEAANFSSINKLDNLIAIADINRLGQSGETMFGHHIEEYISRFSAFGFECLAIDGNNLFEVDRAFAAAQKNDTGKPFAIIARTFKGRGISFLENKENWHGKPLKEDELEKALSELGELDETLRFELKKPSKLLLPPKKSKTNVPKINFKKGEAHATREVYGQVLALMAKENNQIYALDAEVKNSTYAQYFSRDFPDRYVECFISEQNMAGIAIGLQRLGKDPFLSSFAAFLTRAADQIRMASVGNANLKIVGSHAGVSIGEDGPSQMGLEDIALFGAIPGSIIFHPSDSVSTSKILPLALDYQGISYVRTLRPKTKTLYGEDENFQLGGSKILKQSKTDILTIVATGITVHEALIAHAKLADEGINARVVDCYSIKPIDAKTLIKCLNETKKNIIITVEDHFMHGGLGDFVLEAVSAQKAQVAKIAVTSISSSGDAAKLMAIAGIDSAGIINKVKSIV